MTRLFTLVVTIIMLAGCISIDVEINDDLDSPAVTPIQTVAQYVQDFNNADLDALNEGSGSPFFWLMGDEKNVYDKYGESVDFVRLRSKGWSYSKINSLELIYEDDKTAMVYMNFSRYSANDEVILTSEVNYLLVNNAYKWKIKGGFAPNKVTVGKD
ncbi:MAG: hypothetical protein HN723_04705 [Porticoccaceae bacterium]|jgi:hypothetical protein|nr:hypothetical protein [Porticoccaceae bacterium]